MFQCESFAQPASNLVANFSWFFALNNLQGAVLYRTPWDYFKFQAQFTANHLRPEQLMLRWVLAQGFTILENHPYFYMLDKNNKPQVGGLTLTHEFSEK